jgi:AcrR family transcriptional regulator
MQLPHSSNSNNHDSDETESSDPPIEAASDGSDAERDEPARRRMAPGDRRSMILNQAAEFFASNGPAASTRALAKALGITQALLYRYFPSKEALVRAVYNERFGQRWDPSWITLLQQQHGSLEERLTTFFAAYIERLSAADYRLWMRAALEGWSFARFYHHDLVDHVLTPIVAELRNESGLPTLQAQPILYGELEIAFSLHGALTFLRIRRDVYNAPVHPDTLAAVRLHVGIFMPGALQQIRLLHQPGAPAALTVPPLSV